MCIRDRYSGQTSLPGDAVGTLEDWTGAVTLSIVTSAAAVFPLTRGKFGRRPRALWWNQECEEVLKKRNRAYNIWRRFPSNRNGLAYRRLAARCRRFHLKCKRDTWNMRRAKLSFTTPDSRTWSLLKSMTSAFVPQSFPLTRNGGLLLHNLEKAELFADHYEQVFRPGAPLPSSAALAAYIQNSKLDPPTFLGCKFTASELNHTLSSLPDSKATGADLVDNRFLKYLSSGSRDALLNLYNASWTQGIVPMQWKLSVILPFLKPNQDSSTPKGYRAIQLLSCTGKVLERMVQARLRWWLESFSLLSPIQYGFRPGVDTTDCLLALEHIIYTGFHNKQYTLVLFFDLEAAFDSVSHMGLLYKLASLGLKGHPLKWFHSFLTNRSLSVRVGGVTSSVRPALSGVPQGSALSPLLFALYISDLPTPASTKVMAYADDLVLCATSPTLLGAQRALEAGAQKILDWADRWHLRFNIAKCALMCFTTV